MKYIHNGSGIDFHLRKRESMPFFMLTSSDTDYCGMQSRLMGYTLFPNSAEG